MADATFPESPARPAQIAGGRLTGAAFLAAPSLQKIMACLNGDGEETRIAGGAVRNALLGEPVQDVDLATTALPDVVMARANAAGMKVVPTGIDHGTVTVIADGAAFEITTLREDVETDGRRAVVRFGRDFAADAMRRDFTINALFVDAQHVVHDYVGGLADISARRVRFIGDARARIEEDYLRILRFFRMHAAYGYGELDREGLHASIAGRQGMLGLSRERIGAELQKLLAANGAGDAVEAMAHAGLLGMVIGGVPHVARLRGLIAVEKMLGLKADATLRLAALAAQIEEDVERLRGLLRLSNLQAARMDQALLALLPLRGVSLPPVKTDLVRYLYVHGRRAAVDGLAMAQAGAAADAANPKWNEAQAFLRATPEPRLPFTGADLMRRGLQSGPAVGAALKRLQVAWIRAGFPREPEVLARLLDEALRNNSD